jgi:hypothetical protein
VRIGVGIDQRRVPFLRSEVTRRVLRSICFVPSF